MKPLRKRLTYANVMSSLAVFLVLGGATAFAATQLAKNSVGSKQLKKNAVTAAKIKKNAVTGAKVKSGSLDASDFAAGQLPAGPKGATGPTFGVTSSGESCDSLGATFEVCATTGAASLPASGPVLLVASAEWDNDDDGTPPNSGECRFSVDGTPLADPDVTFGEETATHGIDEGGSISMNTVTGPLPAGAHTFALECNEEEPTVYIAEAMLSAVLLGS